MKRLFRISLWFSMILYLLLLSEFVLFKYFSVQEILQHFMLKNEGTPFFVKQHNYIPLKTISSYLIGNEKVGIQIAIQNLTGNIVGFLPFGFLLPLLLKKEKCVGIVVFLTFCLSLLFELTQLVFQFGSFDVDDLLLNTLGGVLGYLLYCLALSIFSHLSSSTSNLP